MSLLFILLYLCAFTHETIYFQKGLRKVFFSARAFEESTDSNGVITFTHIDANEGEGFNKESGRFRAPVAGTYQFDFFGYVGNEKIQTKVTIYKDDSDIYSFWGTASATLKYTWMLKVSSGEEVYLKLVPGKLQSVSFSGQLLKADD